MDTDGEFDWSGELRLESPRLAEVAAAELEAVVVVESKADVVVARADVMSDAIEDAVSEETTSVAIAVAVAVAAVVDISGLASDQARGQRSRSKVSCRGRRVFRRRKLLILKRARHGTDEGG